MILSMQEFAKQAKVSRQTVYNLMNSGKIKSKTYKKEFKGIPETELKKLIKGKK